MKSSLHQHPVQGQDHLDGPITDEQRLAVLQECADFVNALGDLKSDAAQQIVVAWLKTRPEFEEADTLDGNVWAYFRDGRVAMIVPNWIGGGDNMADALVSRMMKAERRRHRQADEQAVSQGATRLKCFMDSEKHSEIIVHF